MFQNASEGNANIYGSNVSLSLTLGGQEGLILIEFCKKYHCIISTCFDYGDELWGSFYPNHTGKGVLGAVAKYEVEVAGGSFYVNWNRLNFIQYSVTIQLSTVTHALPKPKPLPSWYTPILPFTPVTWACVLVALLVAAISLIFLDRARLNVFPQTEVKAKSVMNTMITVLKISVYQNVSITTKAASSLVMFATLLAFALTLGSFYSGEIFPFYLDILHQDKNFHRVRWAFEFDDSHSHRQTY